MLAVVGGAAALANAQAQSNPPVTITYTLAWSEVSATAPYAPVAVPNGTIDPGEGARFTFTAAMSPAPGTSITYPASLLAGSAGAGIVGGFWAGDLNLTGGGGGATAAGSWVVNQNTTPSGNPNRLGVLPPFAAGFPTSSGTANANGSGMTDIQPAQFGADPSTLNSASPTPTMWRGLWIPSSYAQRTVPFALSLGSLGLNSLFFAQDNTVTLPVAIAANSNYGAGVNVPIVPAPSSLALLGLGGLVAARRRR
jgi:hypothetical protein